MGYILPCAFYICTQAQPNAVERMTDLNPTPPGKAQPERASTLQEVADRKCVSLRTLYNESAAGRLMISKIGARSVVFESDELAYDELIRTEARARRSAPEPQPEEKTAA